MAPVRNGRLLFNEVPKGYPEPGKTTVYDDTETIDIDTVPLNGGLLIKTIALSVDPYMRGRMRENTKRSYNQPFEIGKPLENFGLGVVIRSEVPEIQVGQKVHGFLPFQEYIVYPGAKGLRLISNAEGIPWTAYLGVAGMPGKTAYYAWKEYASPQEGDVVFVTTAAGPVGSFVVQLAKADGLKVIASAGSEEKVQFVKSIGADVAFNYKTEKPADVLEREGLINIYWDNVGGESLEAALGNAAKGARFIECGMISGYNGQAPAVNNLFRIIQMELKIFGFIQSTLAPKYEEQFYEEVPKLVRDGVIKYTEDVTKGLENGGHAILDVQSGRNKGKSVILVAEDEL